MTADIAAIRARAEKARDMVSALCKPRNAEGAREWIMHIPARPDHDPDLVIGDALDAVPPLCDEVEALRQRVGELEGALKPFADYAPACRALHPDDVILEEDADGTNVYELTAGAIFTAADVLAPLADRTPSPAPESGAHDWRPADDVIRYPNCRICGVIRAAADNNKPCRGPSRIALRAPSEKDPTISDKPAPCAACGEPMGNGRGTVYVYEDAIETAPGASGLIGRAPCPSCGGAS